MSNGENQKPEDVRDSVVEEVNAIKVSHGFVETPMQAVRRLLAERDIMARRLRLW